MSPDHESTSTISENLVLFSVGPMLCGLQISKVREINKHMEITRVFHAPPTVRGIMNLRGQIITVVDLSVVFGFEPPEMSDQLRLLVVNSPTGESIGFLVDEVDDIVPAESDDLVPPPSNTSGVAGEFFSGVFKMENDLVALLDIESIIQSQQEQI